ncbi:MAG: hypothetical protein COV46_08390 [Deltaproteobacteria bacterium CG11_big_fil_rev_8_21_14_0_20_49_13]|nr:MAG: hypothetical protein COV46_08390 [Deltaproteobacteria bacterium CG11_big_fil_rev_8_21_14_0_20_49_13]
MWIEREISKQISGSVATFPAVILTGARQTGKTSLLKRLFPEYSFVTLDLPSNAELAEREPQSFIERYPPPIIVDEVQYAPGLFRYLKNNIDGKRDQYGRFILTGSQKFTLMKNVSDSLAGRCAIFELETLSASEVLSAKKISTMEMILTGGFPELHAREDLRRDLFYQSYTATYLERDVRSILNIGQLRDFERFLRACALRSGQILNKSEVARDVGISPTTVGEWLSVLQASNQVVLLEPWFNNKTKSLIKSPKIYFNDTGLLCYLTSISNIDELTRSPFIGSIWETFVFSELRKRQVFVSGKWDIWFWRDNRGTEVDFLIHKGGRFELIEAKFSEVPVKKDAKNLEEVAGVLGRKNIEKMTIVSRTDTAFPLTDGITVVPIVS